MNDPDNFLSRWSRRKLEPQKEGSEGSAPQAERITALQPGDVAAETSAVSVPGQDQPQEEFDVASLPPIESITAGTDIRDFLKPGVPQSLSRAALRRVWASDPAIRDFIGIAENQWDFTDGSIPGFGPLDPADIPGLLAKIIGSTKEGMQAAIAQAEEQARIPESASLQTAISKDETHLMEESADAASNADSEALASSGNLAGDASPRSDENVAPQKDKTDEELSYTQIRNGHGSALPS